MSYQLDTFLRTTRPLPFWGYDHARGSLTALPPGSFVVFRPRQDDVTGADFTNGYPVAFLGANEVTFSDLSALETDLDDYANWMAARGIQPFGIMYEEEWYPRATHDPVIRAWPIFAGLDEVGVRQVVHDRLTAIYAAIKLRWSLAYTVAVEPVWHDSLLFGSDFFAPPVSSVDILGVDAYLTAHGNPRFGFGTPALTDQADQAMLDKFFLEVGRFAEEAARLAGQNPVLLVAQAFRDLDPASTWGTAPTPDQLEWWYRLAQGIPTVSAVEWFCAESLGAVVGLAGLPAQRARVEELFAYNQSLIS